MAGGLSPRLDHRGSRTTRAWINDRRSPPDAVAKRAGRVRLRQRPAGRSVSSRSARSGPIPTSTYRDRDDAVFTGRLIVAEAASGGSGGREVGRGCLRAVSPAGRPQRLQTSATVRMAGRAFSRGVTGSRCRRGSVSGSSTTTTVELTATGEAFDTGVLDSGGRSTKMFPSASTFSFLCQIHPDMRGRSRSVADPKTRHRLPARRRSPSHLSSTVTPSPDATQAAVAVVDFEFEPSLLEVTAGTTVTWHAAWLRTP